MVLDFNAKGTLIGIEILDPHEVRVEVINDILRKQGLSPLSEKELAPIVSA
ncbi:MAG: hypothetical protein BMS9Abin37_0917 [Acidobacteriota bacterium]|nr:MAG: hypothetical protein BMS9Abin37_0917 [Acidobacteriota bacterium]